MVEEGVRGGGPGQEGGGPWGENVGDPDQEGGGPAPGRTGNSGSGRHELLPPEVRRAPAF